MKKAFLLLIIFSTAISCDSIQPKQTNQIEISYNVPFVVDSVEFTLFYSGHYASFSSKKIADDTTLLKIIGYGQFLKDKTLYFYFRDFNERGEHYASIIDSAIMYRAETPVVNKVSRYINRANDWIFSINGQFKNIAFLKGDPKLIAHTKEIISEDLAKLKESIRLAKDEINDLNKGIFKEEADQIKHIESITKKIERKYRNL